MAVYGDGIRQDNEEVKEHSIAGQGDCQIFQRRVRDVFESSPDLLAEEPCEIQASVHGDVFHESHYQKLAARLCSSFRNPRDSPVPPHPTCDTVELKGPEKLRGPWQLGRILFACVGIDPMEFFFWHMCVQAIEIARSHCPESQPAEVDDRCVLISVRRREVSLRDEADLEE